MHKVIIAKCCICGKVRKGSLWTDESDALKNNVLYSHTYCPDCLEQVLAELEQSAETKILAPSFTEEERLYAIVE